MIQKRGWFIKPSRYVLIVIFGSMLMMGCPKKFDYDIKGRDKNITGDSIELMVQYASPWRSDNRKVIFLELSCINRKVKDTSYIKSSDWKLFSTGDTFYPVTNTDLPEIADYDLQDTVALIPGKATNFTFLFVSKNLYSSSEYRRSIITDTITVKWTALSQTYQLEGWKYRRFIWEKGR